MKMKKILKSLIFTFIVFIPVSLFSEVLFFDQNGRSQAFDSDKIESLKISINLPQHIKDYNYDFIQVIVAPSYNPKMEWRKGWMKNEMNDKTLSDITLVPASNFVNGYGSAFELKDIKDFPSAKGFNSFSLNVSVKIFIKTGESEETRWDKDKQKYVTETIFQWDEGKVIDAGSASFTVAKITAEEKQGMDKDKALKLKQLNSIRAKMGKPPLTDLP